MPKGEMMTIVIDTTNKQSIAHPMMVRSLSNFIMAI